MEGGTFVRLHETREKDGHVATWLRRIVVDLLPRAAVVVVVVRPQTRLVRAAVAAMLGVAGLRAGATPRIAATKGRDRAAFVARRSTSRQLLGPDELRVGS